jgi:hypothetical protein
MNGQRVGYIRVSSADQNPQRQLKGAQANRARCQRPQRWTGNT